MKLEFLFYIFIATATCSCPNVKQQNKGHVETIKAWLKKMEKKTRSKITAIGFKLGNVEDFLSNNLALEEYWLKRASAVVIDYFVILIATGIIWPNFHFLEFVLASGVLSLLYFSVMETGFGYTLGKKLFSLKVITSKKGKPTLKTSLIRNISKFNIAILLVDTVIGFSFKCHQKYVDKIAKTNVVEISIPQTKPISEVIYYEQATKLS